VEGEEHDREAERVAREVRRDERVARGVAEAREARGRSLPGDEVVRRREERLERDERDERRERSEHHESEVPETAPRLRLARRGGEDARREGEREEAPL